MDLYRVSKVLSENKRGKMFLVYDLYGDKKSLTVRGNLPEIYDGMIIGLEISTNASKGAKKPIYEVVDYAVEVTAKNETILKNKGVDVERYKEMLFNHLQAKKEGVTWEVASIEVDKLYDNLCFADADKKHKEKKNEPKAEERLRAICKEILTKARGLKKIEYEVDEFIGYVESIEEKGAYNALSSTDKIELIMRDEFGFAYGKIYDVEMTDKENYVRCNMAKRNRYISELLEEDEIASFINKLSDSLMVQEQIDVLWCLKDKKPCIITGGAGTGKTTVVKSIIECYSKYYDKDEILLVAPTGKASVRLENSTKMPTSTIHKALRKSVEEEYAYYNGSNKLPHKLAIVDESSMIDTALMYDLLRALSDDCKIIFVGDHNQLRPVGYGEPFYDFIKTLYVYELTQNHRQSEETDILANANNVLANIPLFNGRSVKVEHISKNAIFDMVEWESNAQILTQYRELNAQINNSLKFGQSDFNVGDKVILLKNTDSYCNGDIGYIVKIEKGRYYIELEDVGVYRDTTKIVVDKKSDMELAYAITVHKMQGSEAEKVIVFLRRGKVSKSMLYTAITRARCELEIYYYDEVGEGVA